MAIYTSVPPPSQQAPGAGAIEAWTVSALQALHVSSGPQGNAVVGIALDVPDAPADGKANRKDGKAARKEPLKRDSQRRREALLRGKEGSRRRQRWENDHLLHVPNAQPPLPSDWEVHPTYPVHTVPYYLAPLWESSLQHRSETVAASKRAQSDARKGVDGQKGRVPQELRERLKRAKGARSLLQELEEEVRGWVRGFELKEEEKRRVGRGMEGGEDEELVDSEDEEIVFVGRNVGLHSEMSMRMSEAQREVVEEQLEREKLIFDSLVDEQGGGFGRWLVHSLALYYGLSSRSVTVGDPARREAYVGIKELKSGRGSLDTMRGELPRPLWGLV